MIAGAAISNYVEVTSMLRESASGAVTGVRALDRISGEAFDIKAKGVLFCGKNRRVLHELTKLVWLGGPFTDELRRLEDPDCADSVAGAAGIHVVCIFNTEYSIFNMHIILLMKHETVRITDQVLDVNCDYIVNCDYLILSYTTPVVRADMR